MWYDLPFRNCDLSIDWTENQTSFNSDNSNDVDKWSMFKNREMHCVHLNVDSLLPKIEETPQPTITCSKLTIETHGVTYFQS